MNFNNHRQVSSSTVEHLFETGHMFYIKTAFVVLNRSVQGCILWFIETLTMQKLKLDSCVRNQLVLAFNLSW